MTFLPRPARAIRNLSAAALPGPVFGASLAAGVLGLLLALH